TGRALGTSDTSSVVLGYSVASQTFNDSSMINKQIKIDGEPFRVVGVLNTSGTSFGAKVGFRAGAASGAKSA
ncbi:MAG: ABC transporter permease, partial [Planctomycetota bacterium]